MSKTQDTLVLLKKRVRDLEGTVKTADTLARSVVTYAKEVNLQIDAVVKLLTEKKIFTEDEHEKAFDLIRGLRRKGGLEQIEQGDTVWVGYKTKDPSTGQEIKEESLPVRVGAGAIFWEESLLGKRPGERYSTTVKLPENYSFKNAAGKTMTFDIHVIKAKTRIKEAVAHARTK